MKVGKSITAACSKKLNKPAVHLESQPEFPLNSEGRN